MLSEPMTLYKLMNLYMLKQVNFPLTYAQISDFFLSRDCLLYTSRCVEETACMCH